MVYNAYTYTHSYKVVIAANRTTTIYFTVIVIVIVLTGMFVGRLASVRRDRHRLVRAVDSVRVVHLPGQVERRRRNRLRVQVVVVGLDRRQRNRQTVVPGRTLDEAILLGLGQRRVRDDGAAARRRADPVVPATSRGQLVTHLAGAARTRRPRRWAPRTVILLPLAACLLPVAAPAATICILSLTRTGGLLALFLSLFLSGTSGSQRYFLSGSLHAIFFYTLFNFSKPSDRLSERNPVD